MLTCPLFLGYAYEHFILIQYLQGLTTHAIFIDQYLYCIIQSCISYCNYSIAFLNFDPSPRLFFQTKAYKCAVSPVSTMLSSASESSVANVHQIQVPLINYHLLEIQTHIYMSNIVVQLKLCSTYNHSMCAFPSMHDFTHVGHVYVHVCILLVHY